MDVSSPEGLADHAETIADYLYDYGKDQGQRNKNSTLFFEYLLSACWEKLYRRFSSWQGLGLIMKFEKHVHLLEKHLELTPSEDFMKRGPGDRTLVNFLSLNQDIFDSAIKDAHPRGKPELEKFRDAVVYASRTGNDDLNDLYTRETALGFHYLAYSAFILAGRVIRKIKDQKSALNNTSRKNASAVEEFKNSIKIAVAPIKLLQCVLASTVFKRHIEVWTNHGESVNELLPKWSEKTDSLEFGVNRQILAKEKKGPTKNPVNDDGPEVCDLDDNGPEVCKSIY